MFHYEVMFHSFAVFTIVGIPLYWLLRRSEKKRGIGTGANPIEEIARPKI
jgi:hypothetical protein